MTRSVVIASSVRTAIGGFGGSLSNHSPADLGAAVAQEAIARAGIDADAIQKVVFRNVIHTPLRGVVDLAVQPSSCEGMGGFGASDARGFVSGIEGLHSMIASCVCGTAAGGN